MYVYMYVYVYIYISVFTYSLVCVCKIIFIFVCIYLCMYVAASSRGTVCIWGKGGRTDTCLEEDELWLKYIQQKGQPHFQDGKVLGVSHAGLQLNVYVGALLLGEVVLLAVHAEGEHTRVLGKQHRIPVSL